MNLSESGYHRLFATDFDNTYAMTSELSPNGVTVAYAYERAVETLFGPESLSLYRDQGGLMNRGPAEVVSQLAPEIDHTEHGQRTEELVQLKLAHLLNEIGQKLPDGSFWPKLSPGFKNLWIQIVETTDIGTAVVSSGHRSFIERVHDVHELPTPDFMVTDDDMRPLMGALPQEMCLKPSGLLLELIHREWLSRHPNIASAESLSDSKRRMIYAGDDPHKDGEMAKNYGIDFFHIAEPQHLGWFRIGNRLLSDYIHNAA